jgi:hypothetical protein
VDSLYRNFTKPNSFYQNEITIDVVKNQYKSLEFIYVKSVPGRFTASVFFTNLTNSNFHGSGNRKNERDYGKFICTALKGTRSGTQIEEDNDYAICTQSLLFASSLVTNWQEIHFR